MYKVLNQEEEVLNDSPAIIPLDEEDRKIDDSIDNEKVIAAGDDVVLSDQDTPVDIEPQPKKFPYKELAVIYFITASDSIALSVIAPFVADMCKNRFGVAEENVGIASGFLIGGFSLATFLSSFLIGHLSDLYGRKPLLLMGLISGAICTFVFGLSGSYWLALFIRMVAGFTNGNIALSKSVITDLTTGPSRAMGFAYMGASFSLARAISSSVSGLTTGIIIPGVPLLDDPYVMPCLIGGSVNALGLIATIIFVPETLKKSGQPTKKKNEFTLRKGLVEVARDSLQRKLITVYSLTSFANGALLLGMVLLFSLQTDYHGLGFSPLENGIVYTWFGLCAAIFQIVFFKKVSARLKLRKMYVMGLTSLGGATSLMPCASLFFWFGSPDSMVSRVLMWIFLVIVVIPLAIGFMTALPVVNTMQSNASNPERIGLLSGTAQSVSGLLRSFGPVVAGFLFSFSTAIRFPFLLFWFLGMVYFSCYLLTRGYSEIDHKRIEGEHIEEIELDEQVLDITIDATEELLENSDRKRDSIESGKPIN